MSKAGLGEQLQDMADWIGSGNTGVVREPNPDNLREIAGEVKALKQFHEDALDAIEWDGKTIRERDARIEKLEAALQKIEGMDDPRQLIGEARHIAREAFRREYTGK